MIFLITIWKRCLTIVAIFVLLPLTAAQAYPSILPLDEVKPGMKGIAKTVVSGTAIEEFNVEVLNVMKNPGAGDLILVRTSGAVIDQTGGIVQGMSGSPVYIDGKLVGAIAYGWPLSDHTVGMVTPIADMLKLWDLGTSGKPSVGSGIAGEKQNLLPAATPLMVSGLSDHAMTMLQDKLSPYKLFPYAVGSQPETEGQAAALEPGSAVGIELVRGDVSVGAIGTVTYTEGNKVLAFGHPFLQRGKASYLLTDATIYTVVNGLESGFKVGSTGDLLGMVTQDRKAGIAGIVGQYPSVIPMRITVTDTDVNKIQDDAVQVVQNEELAPILSATTAYSVMEKAMDRIGAGSAKVSFEISARNMPGETLRRENMFYSPVNIGEMAVSEFFEALNLLMTNPYNPVDIMDVKMQVTVNQERQTASIVDAQAKVAAAKPGETVPIQVKLKPYRSEPVSITVNYTVPKEQAAGPLLLEVRGGGMIPLTQLLLKKQGLDVELKNLKAKAKNMTFADSINEFTSRDRNNAIVVEVLDTGVMPQGMADSGKAGSDDKAGLFPVEESTENSAGASGTLKGALTSGTAETVKPKTCTTTDYIIDNDAQVLINVVTDHKSK
ncbi:SpoIVB peptidase S55 domain-containing protein [Propionispora hippei]|uniref:SpoIVB peptidase S55 n=1 Tax=Propionispora hippei DSM 15287 TaxID=1123003 RepID=A0A1M6BTV1_9FIRM|nr:SpoIVB peptidase S55 domain-containing protein [Propionispora hippei]SHI52023.1 SpoIVB peptidase S55 [Propionispora hippei DSM 15287]